MLGVAIRREPWIFTLSTLGSVLFGALTVADAWVLGWATDHVVLPGLRGRARSTPGCCGRCSRSSSASRSCGRSGIVARRLGAGVMQYRMQAHYRRAVTRQYLPLPMEWHQRHPTGQLLSNANSDVEAAWGADRAAADGGRHRRDDGDRGRPDAARRPGAGRWSGLLVFPAVIVANLAYQRLASPLMTRAQAAARRGQRDRARVLRRRDGGQDARPGGRGDRALRGQGPRAARRRHPGRPDPRRRSTRCSSALPNIGVLVVLGRRRRGGCSSGATDAGDVVTVAYLLTIVSFPIRSIGWLLGEFPRSVVGFQRVQPVLRRHRRDAVRRRARLPDARRGARLEVDAPRLLLRARPAAAATT